MKLMDLRPMYRAIYRDHHLTPDNGGIKTDNLELSFQCPKCPPGCRVHIKVGPSVDAGNHIWQVSPLPPMSPEWPSLITVMPSINNTVSGHGRKNPTCTFHGSIINGEVHLS